MTIYPELEKYIVCKEKVMYNVAGTEKEIPITQNKVVIKLGDLIKLYMEHLKKPWYKRNNRYDLYEEKYRSLLNKVGNIVDYIS